jgi:predicted nuclease of predicted toxin-antitoxin system
MKILIDKCVPAGLAEVLRERGCQCDTLRQAGYSSKKNGELMSLAEVHWGALLTIDRNIKYQQNVSSRRMPSARGDSVVGQFENYGRQSGNYRL